jgi:hypothetical protein
MSTENGKKALNGERVWIAIPKIAKEIYSSTPLGTKDGASYEERFQLVIDVT